MTRKLDKEHLESIQKLRTQFSEAAAYIGNISIEKHLVEKQLEQLKTRELELMNQFERLQKEESELVEQLKERYGNGEINIAAGTFTPES